MANDGQLLVNFAALQKAADDIGSAIGKMRSTLSDVENAARPLISDWEGCAQQTYNARQQKWRQAADDLPNILNSVKGAVIFFFNDTATTEKSNTALFS